MKLTNSPNLDVLLDPAHVFPDLHGEDKSGILLSLSCELEKLGAVPSSEELYRKLLEREELGSTAVGQGVAIPHCKLSELDKVVMAVGLVPEGVALETPDSEPVRVFFLLASPEASPSAHLQGLATISKWLKNGDNVDRIQRATSKEDLFACLSEDAGEGGE